LNYDLLSLKAHVVLALMKKGYYNSYVNPIRNSSVALNPAGIIIKPNPAAEQQGIISNGVNF
jgi:hypothetical protein